MVTQAQAQETEADAIETPAETPSEENLDTLVDATHGEAVGDTHATTEHADDHSGVFPPFDPVTFPSQLLWLAITFGALYLLMSKVALPRIGSILADRKARIDADLEAADVARRKTDAAIAAYEQALADARANAQAIAGESRDAITADINARRTAIEADLARKMAEAEARIAGTKEAALAHVDEIATETVQAVVAQLVGDTSPEAARAAVAKAKE
jgi:F-type H+-transporting ATPase subunit b